jgi:hypothetical protein
MTVEQQKAFEDFGKAWEEVVYYAFDNGFDVPEFVETMSRKVFHQDDHVDQIKKKIRSKLRRTQEIFNSLYVHGGFRGKHGLQDALVHTHIHEIEAQDNLKEEQLKQIDELESKCYECALKKTIMFCKKCHTRLAFNIEECSCHECGKNDVDIVVCDCGEHNQIVLVN